MAVGPRAQPLFVHCPTMSRSGSPSSSLADAEGAQAAGVYVYWDCDVTRLADFVDAAV
jgi:hypothetical protein